MPRATSWWLRFTFWRPRSERPDLRHLRLVMYTRRGCHLCTDAWHYLEKARHRYGFALEAVDVDTDAELVRQYGLTVPVLTVDGKLRFRGGVNPVLFERLLRAEASRPGRNRET